MKTFVWLLIGLLGGSGCAAIKYPRAFTHPPTATTQKLLYATADHQKLHLHLYHPSPAPARNPVILWVHGGGWFGGSPRPCPVAWLTKRGYTVIAVEYRRLNRQAPFPAQLTDLRAALAWIRAHPDLCRADPDRIGVIGASAGGLLATLLGLDPANQLDCVVTFFPVTDPARLLTPEYPVNWRMRFAVRHLLRAYDATATDPALLQQVSARQLIQPGAAPHLIVHGSRDAWIPAQHSADFVARLRRANVDARLHLVAGFGHGDVNIATPAVRQAVTGFLAQYLGVTS